MDQSKVMVEIKISINQMVNKYSTKAKYATTGKAHHFFTGIADACNVALQIFNNTTSLRKAQVRLKANINASIRNLCKNDIVINKTVPELVSYGEGYAQCLTTIDECLDKMIGK